MSAFMTNILMITMRGCRGIALLAPEIKLSALRHDGGVGLQVLPLNEGRSTELPLTREQLLLLRGGGVGVTLGGKGGVRSHRFKLAVFSQLGNFLAF